MEKVKRYYMDRYPIMYETLRIEKIDGEIFVSFCGSQFLRAEPNYCEFCINTLERRINEWYPARINGTSEEYPAIYRHFITKQLGTYVSILGFSMTEFGFGPKLSAKQLDRFLAKKEANTRAGRKELRRLPMPIANLIAYHLCDP